MNRVCILIIALFISNISIGQRIRKEWSELTPAEGVLFSISMAALDGAFIEEMADEHDRLFNDGIHTTEEFLPWHRLFLYEMENRIQASGSSDITIPYWNWYNDWGENSFLFGLGPLDNEGLIYVQSLNQTKHLYLPLMKDGFDIVQLDFNTNPAYIQRNAELLITLIKDLNAEMEGDNANYKC